MTDISLIPILKSEGWKVMTRAKLKSMKKEELIETIEMLENNWGATIERANNSYNYGKSEIERLEKQNTELKAQIEQLQQSYTITVDKSVIREQELEKENAELKAQTESDQLALNESEEIIAELKAREKALGERVLQLQKDKGKSNRRFYK